MFDGAISEALSCGYPGLSTGSNLQKGLGLQWTKMDEISPQLDQMSINQQDVPCARLYLRVKEIEIMEIPFIKQFVWEITLLTALGTD